MPSPEELERPPGAEWAVSDHFAAGAGLTHTHLGAAEPPKLSSATQAGISLGKDRTPGRHEDSARAHKLGLVREGVAIAHNAIPCDVLGVERQDQCLLELHREITQLHQVVGRDAAIRPK